MANSDKRIEEISNSLRAIPDFPKPGILFQDVTTILLNPEAFGHCIDILAERYQSFNIDAIAGKEHVGETHCLL